MEYHPHTGSHYSKHPTYLSYDFVCFVSIFQHGFGWVWKWASFLMTWVLGTFLTQNDMVWEHAYICAGCLIHCITVVD